MKKIYFVVILLAVMLLHNPVLAINKSDKKEARKFFDQYVALSNNFDTSIASLYSDTVKVHASSKSPEGIVTTIELPAAKWKELVVKAMPLAKQQGDTNKYTKIKISSKGENIKIKAKRYSMYKCFTDNGYYMVIARDNNNKFKIVEEYVETQSESSCKGAKDVDLVTMLKNTRDQTKVLLPLMVDEDTRLDDVAVTKNTFQYQYTLINYASEDLDSTQIKAILTPIVRNQACTLEILKQMMGKGATVSFSYRGKNGKEVATMDITDEQCKQTASK